MPDSRAAEVKAVLRGAQYPLTKTELTRSGQVSKTAGRTSLHAVLQELVAAGELEEVQLSCLELRRQGRPAGEGRKRRTTRGYRLADSPF